MADLKGEPVQIGERTFIVPRVTVDAYFRMKEEAAEHDGGDMVPLLVSQILTLLQRNYPDLTRGNLLVDTGLELADLNDIHQAVTAAAYKPRLKGPDAGEARGP
jgi:hypothetical protein